MCKGTNLASSLQVLLCILLCVLPVVGSSPGAARASGPADLGLAHGPYDRQLPLALPEYPDEEPEGNFNHVSRLLLIADPYVLDEMDDHPSRRWMGRSPPGGGRRGRGQKLPRHSSKDCRVERREMKVRDLGLGYDSDEIVLFKFCVGSCLSTRNNYDLALKALLENGSLPRRTARKVSSHPCCRPDRYEPVSFMDAQTSWQTIDSLSAASCMCIG
uniref:Artemin n=1 Tax=Neogobius melanostomus TaxID=47308 RepID=A0A8C6T8I5_9GOBI